MHWSNVLVPVSTPHCSPALDSVPVSGARRHQAALLDYTLDGLQSSGGAAAAAAIELETKVMRRFAKISLSWRTLLLGPSLS